MVAIGDAAESAVPTARTDARGRFTFASLPPGHYVIQVEDERLDSLAHHVPHATVDVVSGREVRVALAVPTAAHLVQRWCGSTAVDTSSGAYAGQVVEAGTRAPVVDARVVIEWADIDVDSNFAVESHTRRAAATTDSSGIFRFCGVPTYQAFLAQAQLDSTSSGLVFEQIGDARVTVRTFAIAREPGLRRPIVGTVLGERGQPVPNAQVSVIGTSIAAHANSAGRFVLDSVAPGTTEIQGTAIGYFPTQRIVDVNPGAGELLVITLGTFAHTLEALRVESSRLPSDWRHRSFEDARAHGHGQFLTAADINARNVRTTTQLFRTMPGFWFTGEGFQMRSNRGPTTLQGALPVNTFIDSYGIGHATELSSGMDTRSIPNNLCQPAVVIDGTPMPEVQEGDGYDPFDTVPPNSIYGIEIYRPGESGSMKYGIIARCGLIVIWTK